MSTQEEEEKLVKVKCKHEDEDDQLVCKKARTADEYEKEEKVKIPDVIDKISLEGASAYEEKMVKKVKTISNRRRRTLDDAYTAFERNEKVHNLKCITLRNFHNALVFVSD